MKVIAAMGASDELRRALGRAAGGTALARAWGREPRLLLRGAEQTRQRRRKRKVT